MLRKFPIFVFLLVLQFFSVAPASAEIKEIQNIEEIVPYIQEDALILFDVDDTLMTAKTHLGSHAWWMYLKDFFRHADLLDTAAVLFSKDIEKTIERVPVRPIEPATAALIESLQQSHCVLGLTARGRSEIFARQMDVITIEQLEKIGIHLNRSQQPLFKPQAKLPKEYLDGVLFAGKTSKGRVLLKWLDCLDASAQPSQVIFIDDTEDHLHTVELAAADRGIPCMAFHYTHTRPIRAQFDALLANIQYRSLVEDDRVLSDEEAEAIRHQNPDLEPHFFLEELKERVENYLLEITN